MGHSVAYGREYVNKSCGSAAGHLVYSHAVAAALVTASATVTVTVNTGRQVVLTISSPNESDSDLSGCNTAFSHHMNYGSQVPTGPEMAEASRARISGGV
jgi:hypothetical protein